VGRRGVDVTGSGYGLPAGSCEHGNELPVFIKYEEFLDELSDC
jgi:hypothetical protein